MSKTYCMHCGKEVDGKFCGSCGTPAPVGSMKFLGESKAATIMKAKGGGSGGRKSGGGQKRGPKGPVVGLNKALETEEEAEKRREGTVKVTVGHGRSDIYLRFNEGEDPNSRAANNPLYNKILKEGRLTKRAQGKSKLGAINWKDRHFRLTPLELSYYVSHPGLDPKATRKGVIQLARIRKVMQISNVQFKRANVFCISYANWHLYAEAASSAEVYDWVERIKKAAYAARKMNKFLAFDDAWFVGTLSDVEVKTQLETAQSGDFLVRQSPRKPTDFCLHIKKGARGTTSCPIDERDGFFQIRSNRTRDTLVKQACDLRFKTLAQMIKAFSKGGSNAKLAVAVFGMVLLRPADRETIAPMFATKFGDGGGRNSKKKKSKPKTKKPKKRSVKANPAAENDGAGAVTFFAAGGDTQNGGVVSGGELLSAGDAAFDDGAPPPLPGKATKVDYSFATTAKTANVEYDVGAADDLDDLDDEDEDELYEDQDSLDAAYAKGGSGSVGGQSAGYVDGDLLEEYAAAAAEVSAAEEEDGEGGEDEDEPLEEEQQEQSEASDGEFAPAVGHTYGSVGEGSEDDEEFGGFEDDDINPAPLPAQNPNAAAGNAGGFFDENVTDEEYEDDIYEDIDGLEDADDDGALESGSGSGTDSPPPIPEKSGGAWGFGEGDNDA